MILGLEKTERKIHTDDCDIWRILKSWNKSGFRQKKFVDRNIYPMNMGTSDIVKGVFHEDGCGIRLEVCLYHVIEIEAYRSYSMMLGMSLQLYGFNMYKEISFSRLDYKRCLQFTQTYEDSNYER